MGRCRLSKAHMPSLMSDGNAPSGSSSDEPMSFDDYMPSRWTSSSDDHRPSN